MQVEVNEQNIVLYGLVQLTGNSAEKMLKAAALAKADGYILMCHVPDIANDLIEINTFEAVGSDPADPMAKHGGDSPYGSPRSEPIRDGRTGRIIDVRFEDVNLPDVETETETETETEEEDDAGKT